MKVTNLETSQRLKQLGFESSEGVMQYVKTKEFFEKGIVGKDIYYIGYSLETILDALPKSIKCKDKDYYFWTTYSGSSDCWIMGYVWGNERNMNFETYNEGDESLATTAGRLLIKLLEDKIIKLGE